MYHCLPDATTDGIFSCKQPTCCVQCCIASFAHEGSGLHVTTRTWCSSSTFWSCQLSCACWTQRGTVQAFGRPSASGEANILVVAPTAGRFSYLPISAPASAAAGLRRLAKPDAASAAQGVWPEIYQHPALPRLPAGRLSGPAESGLRGSMLKLLYIGICTQHPSFVRQAGLLTSSVGCRPGPTPELLVREHQHGSG